MDRDLLAVYKAKAIAYDHLIGECPQPQQVGEKWMVEVDHPAKFVWRASVAYIMQERYKNRDNINGVE